MTDGEKEKIKLRANYLNGIALVLMGLGGFGPLFAYVQNPTAWSWRGIVGLVVFFGWRNVELGDSPTGSAGAEQARSIASFFVCYA